MIAKAGVVFASFFLLLATWGGKAAGQNRPEGELTIAFDASIAPTFLDPAETSGLSTPFVFLYALHDALIKPLPGNNMGPCLAESWKESPDRSEEHTSELQSPCNLVCRLLLEKKKKNVQPSLVLRLALTV